MRKERALNQNSQQQQQQQKQQEQLQGRGGRGSGSEGDVAEARRERDRTAAERREQLEKGLALEERVSRRGMLVRDARGRLSNVSGCVWEMRGCSRVAWGVCPGEWMGDGSSCRKMDRCC